ncbi:hypothetical protein SB751_31040, partial [Cupriavidus sp. SIMBA_020]|uniref:hypothetical protein n=1 Tax=Cupriavidus sp. SIMBA_020 TaxID=3085766 RepID=UPI00397B3C34
SHPGRTANVASTRESRRSRDGIAAASGTRNPGRARKSTYHEAFNVLPCRFARVASVFRATVRRPVFSSAHTAFMAAFSSYA